MIDSSLVARHASSRPTASGSHATRSGASSSRIASTIARRGVGGRRDLPLDPVRVPRSSARPSRRSRSNSIASGGCAGSGEHVGVDRSRHDLEHPDAERCELGTQALSDRAHRGLARPIRRVEGHRSRASTTTSRCTTRRHPPRRSAGMARRVTSISAEDVRLVHLAPELHWRRLERRVLASPCRRCSRRRVPRPAARSSRVGHVEPLRPRTAARGLLREIATVVGVAHRRQHVEPAGGQLERDGATDAPARARDRPLCPAASHHAPLSSARLAAALSRRRADRFEVRVRGKRDRGDRAEQQRPR